MKLRRLAEGGRLRAASVTDIASGGTGIGRREGTVPLPLGSVEPFTAALQVARGEADILRHQAREYLPVKAVVLVRELPAPIQHATTHGGAVAQARAQWQQAQALIATVTSAAAADVFRAKGMQPAR